MAFGLRNSSPLHLGAAGNYTSLKGLNPCSSSLPTSSSSPVPWLNPCARILSEFAYFGALLLENGVEPFCFVLRFVIQW